jgi:hypothetical protein
MASGGVHVPPRNDAAFGHAPCFRVLEHAPPVAGARMRSHQVPPASARPELADAGRRDGGRAAVAGSFGIRTLDGRCRQHYSSVVIDTRPLRQILLEQPSGRGRSC